MKNLLTAIAIVLSKVSLVFVGAWLISKLDIVFILAILTVCVLIDIIVTYDELDFINNQNFFKED